MNLKTEREKAGMTGRALAAAVHVSAAAICRYESGERRPRVEVAKRIEKILGIPWYVLVEGKAAEGR